MKRNFLLMLLAVLPVQMIWAGVASCPRGGHHSATASVLGDAARPDSGHRHDDASRTQHDHQRGAEHGTAGPTVGSDFECSGFQFVAVEALAGSAHLLQQRGVVVTAIAQPDHESHIPDGIERPKWCLAA